MSNPIAPKKTTVCCCLDISLSNSKCVNACRKCCSVVFCSDTCREEAWTRYHARECGILALCVAAALNNFSIIAVRALARSHVSEVLRLARVTCSPDIEHGTTSEEMGVYSGEDIVTGLNLVHHSHTLSQDDQLMRTFGEIPFF